MLELKDVTLVSTFNVCHELTILAALECLERVEFADVKLYTDAPDRCGELQKYAVKMDLGGTTFEKFTHHEVPRRAKTSHLLFFQWDSWVVNPGAWRDEFLSYDYVGAPWWYRDGYNVGNSGFCLRSRRLMNFLADHQDVFPLTASEDHVLCRSYQKLLPAFRWAPEDLAWKFSFERTWRYLPEHVFGFHGVFNWPRVMSADKLRERVELVNADEYAFSRPEYSELMRYFALTKESST